MYIYLSIYIYIFVVSKKKFPYVGFFVFFVYHFELLFLQNAEAVALRRSTK